MIRTTLMSLACVAILAAGPVSAQEQRATLYHKLEFSPSVTSAILNSNIRIDSENGSIGTDIDAEDDLGLQTMRWEPRFSMRWRPGRHHEIEVAYQFARRNSERQLERTITIRDTTFDAGIYTRSHLNTDIAYLNYRYAIIAKEKTQAGIGLGLGAMPFDMGIDALASAGAKDAEFSAGEKITVPVGALGLYGRFLHGTDWSSEVDARIVKLQVDRFDVQFAQLNAAARYFTSPKLGFELGAGVDAAKVDVSPKESGRVHVSGRVKYSITNIRFGVVYKP